MFLRAHQEYDLEAQRQEGKTEDMLVMQLYGRVDKNNLENWISIEKLQYQQISSSVSLCYRVQQRIESEESGHQMLDIGGEIGKVKDLVLDEGLGHSLVRQCE